MAFENNLLSLPETNDKQTFKENNSLCHKLSDTFPR